jgi:carboxymethylenebutenolidase
LTLPGGGSVGRMAEETPLSIEHPDQPAVGGIVVVQEAFGVTEHIEDVCRRLADKGWLAVAPHVFHRTGDPVLPYDDFSQVRPHAAALTTDGILADIDAALAYIEGAGFPADTAGIVGFCMGGTIALVTAAERQVGSAVTFYGSGILSGRFGFPPLVELAPKLRAPWLGLFGDDDQGIPVAEVEQLADASATAEVRTEVVRYPAAGHGFHRDGSPAYVEAAATDAWMRTLDWFADTLSTGATDAT